MKSEATRESRSSAFVQMAIGRVNGRSATEGPDTAFCASMRRADNPATEYQSWEYLAHWCDLDKEWERKPFAVIGSAIARFKPKADGTLGVGAAVARCYTDAGEDNGNKKDAAVAKMRRLLACSSTVEACSILRPLLSLIGSRGISLCNARLLEDLMTTDEHFNEWTKPRWAQDFYGRRTSE